MPLLLLFLIVPLIEIALFIQVGGMIGLWPTLAIVVLTAVTGTWMIRHQGVAELGRLRQSLQDLSDPTESLAGGAMILLAGALLLTPGFFTDAVGLLLLIPAVRRAIYTRLRSRVSVAEFRVDRGPQPSGGRPRPGMGDIIDGEYREIGREPDENGPNERPSGWTRH